jgi:hypothetical protein
MKILPLSAICLGASFLVYTAVNAGDQSANISNTAIVAVAAAAPETKKSVAVSIAAEAVASAAYETLGLEDLGLSKEAMLYAYKGQQEMIRKGMVRNEEVLTIVDFSQRSDKKRMYILDLQNMKVLMNTYVAHGKNSGLKYAERFSNTHESLQSSLGFYVTKGTYSGKHGLSLRLDGKDKGFNDNAEARAVVVHGAEYIGDSRAGSAYMGRSFGCPAVPQAVSGKVINMIKNGTTLFIYHPNQKYLSQSHILNS